MAGGDPPQAENRQTLQVRLAIRQYISVIHLWNARHMAWRCRQRQNALVSAGVPGVDIQHSSFALSSIVASTSFLEALINQVWVDAVQGQIVLDRLQGLDSYSCAQITRTVDDRPCRATKHS